MTVVALATSPSATKMLTEIFMDYLEAFRFDRVEKVMKALDWKWSQLPHGQYIPNPVIPSQTNMKDQCWCLFNSCMKSLADDPDLKETYWSGGGFYVRVNRETRLVRIAFEAEYACNLP